MYFALLYGWIGLAVVIFFVLLKIPAPYGRHSKTSWGSMIDNKWGWVLMELPALLTYPTIFCLGNLNKNFVGYFLLSLWVLHYFNRTFIFPFRQKTEGKKIPLIIALNAVIFNVINGAFLGYYLGWIQDFPDNWVSSIPFVTGLIVFFTGMAINWQSDNILLNLRKPGETGYKIPNGGMFKWVSCPNLFGEIVEWLGFALMCWCLPAWAFFIWTIANLLPRAIEHHKWYLQKFDNYPKNRKAVIPFFI